MSSLIIYDYGNKINAENVIRKITYNCAPSDAVWTGSKKGAGVINYCPSTSTITFHKLWGTNPYWWQLLAAAICMVDPQDYTRGNRYKPFKVSIREGCSGCLHLHLDEYVKAPPTIGKYVKDNNGKSESIDISSGEKIPDDISIQFGDLIEFGYALCNHFNMGWSRNPRWWKRGAQAFWRFENLLESDVVDEVDYDPDLNK